MIRHFRRHLHSDDPSASFSGSFRIFLRVPSNGLRPSTLKPEASGIGNEANRFSTPFIHTVIFFQLLRKIIVEDFSFFLIRVQSWPTKKMSERKVLFASSSSAPSRGEDLRCFKPERPLRPRETVVNQLDCPYDFFALSLSFDLVLSCNSIINGEKSSIFQSESVQRTDY